MPSATMTHRAVHLTSVGVALTLALTVGACTSGGADRPPTTQSPTAAGATFTQSLTDRQLIDRHPNGAVMTVRGIQIRPNSIALDVSVLNGYIDEIRLVDDALFRDRDFYLVDDFGNPYRYDRRGGNPDLRIGAGQELTGSIVFLGRVPPEATTVAVKTNIGDPAAAVDLSERDRDTQLPSFYIDGIPIP